ncbi:unnamed protein product [Lampetra planeri]
MVQGVCQLLALVPQLAVESDDYEVTTDEPQHVHLLPRCGFTALAAFPAEVHTITHLPEAVRPPEREEVEEEEEDEEKKDQSVPALELFLSSLVTQEMKQMPRGVYFSSGRGVGLRTDQGKTVAGIPLFMLKSYEKNKQPGLKPGLAAGLLLCYDLPQQLDRDGRPISRLLVSRSRSYQQTLSALIQEICSCQQKQGKESAEELQYKQTCAWLWDSPVVQGNSILALSGLAAALTKYESSLPADGDAAFGRSYSGENTASAIARSCSSLALSLLVPVLLVRQQDALVQVLAALRARSTGSMLGLGLVLAAFCRSGHVHQHVRVTQSLDRLLNTLQDASGLGRVMQETPGFSLALGLVVHGLSVSGHGKAEDVQMRLLGAWVQILLAEVRSDQQQQSSQQQTRLNEVIRSMSQVVTFSGAIGLQSNCASLLGHLHLAQVFTGQSLTAVPQDFSYLPETSVIRSVVDFMTEAGRKGPDFAPPAVVQTAVASLVSVGASVQYPPINWSAVLSPLMRLGFGEDVQHQCLVLAASQAQTSQSASLFLGLWLSAPLVHSLSTRTHLYENLPLWMKHVSEDKLQVYVGVLGLQLFQDAVRAERVALCRSVLRGLALALALPNPPSSCWSVLCSSAENIFNHPARQRSGTNFKHCYILSPADHDNSSSSCFPAGC